MMGCVRSDLRYAGFAQLHHWHEQRRELERGLQVSGYCSHPPALAAKSVQLRARAFMAVSGSLPAIDASIPEEAWDL